MSNETITAIDRDLQPAMYAKRGVALVRGEGALLWDADGNEYIDVMSNYGVNIVGHAHPAITAAIHTRLAVDQRPPVIFQRCAGQLSGITDGDRAGGIDPGVALQLGAEAIEAALKFAHVVTGRPNIVAMQRSYHGRTAAAGQATAPKPGDDTGAGSGHARALR